MGHPAPRIDLQSLLVRLDRLIELALLREHDAHVDDPVWTLWLACEQDAEDPLGFRVTSELHERHALPMQDLVVLGSQSLGDPVGIKGLLPPWWLQLLQREREMEAQIEVR